MNIYRKVLATLLFAWSGHARAEIDLCRLIPYFPSSDVSFEQAASGIDALGCRALSSDSAHTRSWDCDTADNAHFIILTRAVERSLTLLVVGGLTLRNLDGLRRCSLADVRLSGSGPVFDYGSIAVRDRLTVTRRYRPTTAHLLRMIGYGYMVVPSSPSYVGPTSSIDSAERGLFGYQRRAYPTTRVEISGQNLLTSTADTIIAALESRGATVTNRQVTGEILRTITTTAPIGLEGVSSVELQAVNQNVLSVNYAVGGLPHYMTFVGLLDGRYGRSSVTSGTGPEVRDCRFRSWLSESVYIVGEYCPSSGYVISFRNLVAQEQLDAYLEFSRRQPPARARPRIDPDNL